MMLEKCSINILNCATNKCIFVGRNMKLFSLNIITFAAIGALSLSSCINSQEAYEKSKLSGFVATQTKDILAKNPPKVDLSPVETKIKAVEMRVDAMDATNKKAQDAVVKLEEKLKAIETLEKESKSEFERSNTSVVFFTTGSAMLSAAAMQELYRWKSGIDKAPSGYSYTINVNASADKTGPQALNDRLRVKRAEAVKQFMVEALDVKTSINVVTNQEAQSKTLLLDRRALVSISVK
jgi:outer membrane protein OmpA-like peptidoglycan-associated protein